MKEPSGEELIGEDRPPSRYAVPLSTLTAGAVVAHDEQHEEHAEPARLEDLQALPPLGDGGLDAGGD
ncbi:MAG: hypothetical protein ACLGIV_12400 [Actinomycetes bacterium]